MLAEQRLKLERTRRRVKRTRATIAGTRQRPRLAVTKTNRNIFAQLVDDTNGRTLLGVSTLKFKTGTKTEQATKAGEELARKVNEQHITRAVVDRRGSKFHGRIKAFVEATRKGGLQL